MGPIPQERLTRRLNVTDEGLSPRFGASSASPDCGMVSRQPKEVCAYCGFPLQEDELAAREGLSLKKLSPVRSKLDVMLKGLPDWADRNGL